MSVERERERGGGAVHSAEHVQPAGGLGLGVCSESTEHVRGNQHVVC